MSHMLIISILLLSFGCTQEQDEVSKNYTELNWDATALAGSGMSDVLDADYLWKGGKADEAIAKLKIAEEKYRNASSNHRKMCDLAEGRDDLDCPSSSIEKTEKCLIPKIQFFQKKFELDGAQQNCSEADCLATIKADCIVLVEQAKEIDSNCTSVDPNYDDHIHSGMIERCQKIDSG